ncbi:MAG: acylphosphatase [Candidatus Marinimicrobia bacterium]|nr:acylphosphatase [Candidatus Neomarinimicrobiota bacterium]
MIHAEITLSGVVQGVGFRYFTRQIARAYGVGGFVKNLPNGDVYCEAEAEPDILGAFVKELKTGPSMSHVTSVKIDEFKELQNFEIFEVRF